MRRINLGAVASTQRRQYRTAGSKDEKATSGPENPSSTVANKIRRAVEEAQPVAHPEVCATPVNASREEDRRTLYESPREAWGRAASTAAENVRCIVSGDAGRTLARHGLATTSAERMQGRPSGEHIYTATGNGNIFSARRVRRARQHTLSSKFDATPRGAGLSSTTCYPAGRGGEKKVGSSGYGGPPVGTSFPNLSSKGGAVVFFCAPPPSPLARSIPSLRGLNCIFFFLGCSLSPSSVFPSTRP